MSDSTSSPEPSLHIPFALLAIAVAVLLGSQIGATKQSGTIMQWQSETIQKQITSAQELEKKMTDAVKNRETLVKQSGELQGQLQSLLNDVLELAKDDEDAKKVIQKYNIQRAAAPAAGDEKKAP